MPKRNSELIGSRGRSADDAARPETGEERVGGSERRRTCLSRSPELSRRFEAIAFDREGTASETERATLAGLLWTTDRTGADFQRAGP